jgi:hypothetical protein
VLRFVNAGGALAFFVVVPERTNCSANGRKLRYL